MNRDSSNRLKRGFALDHPHRPQSRRSLGRIDAPRLRGVDICLRDGRGRRAIFRVEREGCVYGRTRNPTQALVEECIAGLENAEAALAAASGMAAISSTLWALLQAGDEVVIGHTLCGNSFALFVRGLTRFGVKVAVADFTDLNAAAGLSPRAHQRSSFSKRRPCSNPSPSMLISSFIQRPSSPTGMAT